MLVIFLYLFNVFLSLLFIEWRVLILFELNLKFRFELLLGFFGELILNDLIFGIFGNFWCYMFWILKFVSVCVLFLVSFVKIFFLRLLLLKVMVCFIMFLFDFLVILLFMWCMVLWSVVSILLCCLSDEFGLSLKFVIIKLLGIFGKNIKCIILLLNRFIVRISIVINIVIVV